MTGGGSPQQDRFIHDRLPAPEAWPEMRPLPDVPWTGRLNCVTYLLDRHLEGEAAGRVALRDRDTAWTYAELGERVARLANLMVRGHGIVPGNRVLIRGANTPEVAAIWLAIQKVGAVAVTTMSLLRAGELRVIAEMSKPALAFCDARLAADLAAATDGTLPVVHFGPGGDLEAEIGRQPAECDTCPTVADDVSLVGFTSGTTGRPKATVHFHRDVLAICHAVGRDFLGSRPDDVFIGTPPLAFTFGLGGLLAFPLHAGASALLLPRYAPEELVAAITDFGASVCFTVPTFYQQMLTGDGIARLGGLRHAVSSGEALPLPVREAWRAATGMELTELLGSTEMLHAFAGSSGAAARPGFIGPALPGYELAVLDDRGAPLPPGEIGRLAVRGPTGCRYLDDPRQEDYVQGGWNLTGDACALGADGYVAYHTRNDDMIVSSGYNISGLEVENALLTHPGVAECAVTGEADVERGQVVVAHVVLRADDCDREAMARALQDHVKAAIAPYKYPRRIRFLDSLPRNESGKIQRFRLRPERSTGSA